ncbi:tryptophan transporter [uncultured Finegoldia sp.]|uniref:tryptophan transporter n=1 Tax=uncultured Finegoldia sp. TaxID=328009 RepID=UPI002614E1E6|nr:tryptophan transporter [uncultured Finegoldia sp.]
MNTKKITVSSIFLSVGLLLHYITPALFLGVKPDFLLVMLFLSILFMDNLKEALIVGVFAGFLAAFTTSFPMGQIPNIADKVISSVIVFNLYKLFGKVDVKSNLIFAVGTLVSGMVFLAIAIPMGMGTENFFQLYCSMFTAVCLPTAILNTVVGAFFKKLIYKTNYVKINA